MKNLNNKLILLLCLIFLVNISTYSQKKSISITIDDVPNTTKYQKENFNPTLLELLDSLDIPFTIFINEVKVFKNDFHRENTQLLDLWIKHKNATIGNHSYSHPGYSTVGFENFVEDITKGETLTKQSAKKHNKELNYFRFPYNDLGADSSQHQQIKAYLNSKNYVIAPFTIQSSDWMYDYVYQHYLESGELEKAKALGSQYVDKTIELLTFYEQMVDSIYKRPVKHIYLCHDNAINTDYLGEIISRFRQDGYEIVSFEESLTDPIYDQEDKYYQKWGVSWLYRWMDSQKERANWMKQEPELSQLQSIYNEITKK